MWTCRSRLTSAGAADPLQQEASSPARQSRKAADAPGTAPSEFIPGRLPPAGDVNHDGACCRVCPSWAERAYWEGKALLQKKGMAVTSRTRVTSKGQVTLPVALRRRLAIEAGDDLVFDETPDGAVVRVVHRRRLGDFLGAVQINGAVDHAVERAAAAAKLAERHQ
jgi:AbrB family looped-hinge helix DNA binding protein